MIDKIKIYQKEVRTKLLKYGGLKEIIKKYGVMTIIDVAISKFLNLISKRFYRPKATNYGLSEVFFHPRGIDRWSRYIHVINEIRKINAESFSVLDVGAGGAGISGFASLLRKGCKFFLLDVRKDVFKGLRNVHSIVGDGCRLPFRGKVFDVVVSVDTVEHIPKSIRHSFFKELKRVCKKKIVITCPLQSYDSVFRGREYDIVFQYFYEKNYGVKEPNTAQHIAAGHPTPEEIIRELPGCAIYGYKNCNTWLKYMLFSLKPFLGLFTGLLYYLFWKRNDDKPPYWGAIIILNQNESQK
ncbi:MAG TPA: class I SAM-dependent methyltransferase [Thermococcus sp.]|nr:class I SAM-dependent methyltransferase [Candidatus Baldrarchaeota archaeon]HDH44617.1 class I SAM-dependent methyltransferase [Thermococcus sp.]